LELRALEAEVAEDFLAILPGLGRECFRVLDELGFVIGETLGDPSAIETVRGAASGEREDRKNDEQELLPGLSANPLAHRHIPSGNASQSDTEWCDQVKCALLALAI